MYVNPKLVPKFLFKDEEGRIVLTKMSLEEEQIILIGIYAPNEKKQTSLKHWKRNCLAYVILE